MRIALATLFIALLFVSNCSERKMTVEAPPVQEPVETPVLAETTTVEFKQVGEMLGRSCAPCHNPGGKMYATLPFDNPEIVSSHGPSILGRIKAEEDHKLLETWLAKNKK